jgi:hypothetical protein
MKTYKTETMDYDVCVSIVKYLEHMTKGDLHSAIDCGYLDDKLDVTPKGYNELIDVARVKVYPVQPKLEKLSQLEKLFAD